MPRVDSSAIRQIAYRTVRRELFVRFTSGRKYLYRNVPPAVYRDFRNADSLGRYFNFHIRDRYPFRELP